MKVSAMVWLWIGSIAIVLSIVLQTVALYYPSLTISICVLVLSVLGVLFTIVQGYTSAREFKRERKKLEAQAQEAISETPKGRMLSALSQLRTEMHMDSQEPHS